MKTKYITLIILLSGFSFSAFAQQAPLFGFTSQMLNISNPSMARSVSPLNITMAGRKYWTGIQGSPEAFMGSFAISPEAIKSAVGGFFWAEKAPFISKQVMGLSYAYGLKNMDENNNLRFGMGLDFISVNANPSSILTEDYEDPFYTSMFGANKTSVNFRAGLSFNTDVLEIGAAVQQLIKSKNTLGETIKGELDYTNNAIANGHVKYTIQPDEDVLITPFVFWQAQKNIPLRVDINLLAEKTGLVWGGLWIRPKAAMGLMAGLWVLPDVKIGYMYEKTFLRKLSKLGNSHEIIFTYTPTFKSKEKDVEPVPVRDRWTEPQPKVIRVRDTIVIVKETRVIETARKTTPTTPTYDEPKETVTPAKPAASSGTGRFYIVTGLFSLESNAKNFAKKLQADGYKTILVKNPGTTQLYVSVGRFKSKEEARVYINNNPNSKYTFWIKEMSE